MAGHTLPCFQGLRAGPAGAPCALHCSLPRRPHAFRRARPVVRAALVAEPATLPVRSFQGDILDPEKLSLKVADMTTATGLVHRYITLIRQNARRGTASTKTRAEVRGGGKKPYGQKGTGNARQGSKRSPLKRGGGVIFGPKPCDWTISMNKKERRLALGTALQNAAEAITVIDDIRAGITEIKTKAVVEALGRWGVPADEHTLLIVEELTDPLLRSTRNLPRLTVNTIGALNAYDMLRAENVVIERAALRFIQEFYGPGRWDALEAAAAETSLAPAAEAAEAAPVAEAVGAAPAANAVEAPATESEPAAEAEAVAEPSGEEA